MWGDRYRCRAWLGDWQCYRDAGHTDEHLSFGSPTSDPIRWPNTRLDGLKSRLGSVIDLRHTRGYEPQAGSEHKGR